MRLTEVQTKNRSAAIHGRGCWGKLMERRVRAFGKSPGKQLKTKT